MSVIIYACGKPPITVDAAYGERISDLLARCGILFSFPCGGDGKCGKCTVKAAGELSPPEEAEAALLGDKLNDGIRLACAARILGNASVTVTKEKITSFASAGRASVYNASPLTGVKDCYGAAADIGTTTVALRIFKLPECIDCGYICFENPQTAYGSDVISRIRYAAGGGAEELYNAIHSSLDAAIAALGKKIAFTVVTGNTVMLSLFEKKDVTPLGAFPYTPSTLFGCRYDDRLLMRCASAFIGGDIICALLASGIENEENAFLVDLGTNGEMVCKHDGIMTACSTAAGPAFEGAGISNGMTAAAGAIDRVYICGNSLSYTTIGEKTAVGICGSGFIDAVACMLRLGVVSPDGYLDEPYMIGDSGVFITPSDIRALQLAKAAIRTGIETLAPRRDHISKFYICGGFGEYMNVKSAVAVGLIPRDIADRTVVLGNAALAGACMVLQSEECLAAAERIASELSCELLSESSSFTGRYVGRIAFRADEYVD